MSGSFQHGKVADNLLTENVSASHKGMCFMELKERMGKSAFQFLQRYDSTSKYSCDVHVSSVYSYCAQFCTGRVAVCGCRLQYPTRAIGAAVSSSMHAFHVRCDQRLCLWCWRTVRKSQTLVLMLRCKLLWCLHYRSRYVNNNNNNNNNNAVHCAV